LERKRNDVRQRGSTLLLLGLVGVEKKKGKKEKMSRKEVLKRSVKALQGTTGAGSSRVKKRKKTRLRGGEKKRKKGNAAEE